MEASLWAVRPKLRSVGAYAPEDGPEAEASMFYVYLLKSIKDESFYIGQTDDIKKRLQRHNSGFVQTTKNRVPWIVLGYEQYDTREKARWREYELKHNYLKKKKFIERFCPHSLMDKVAASEAADRGSTPRGGIIIICN